MERNCSQYRYQIISVDSQSFTACFVSWEVYEYDESPSVKTISEAKISEVVGDIICCFIWLYLIL